MEAISAAAAENPVEFIKAHKRFKLLVAKSNTKIFKLGAAKAYDNVRELVTSECLDMYDEIRGTVLSYIITQYDEQDVVVYSLLTDNVKAFLKALESEDMASKLRAKLLHISGKAMESKALVPLDQVNERLLEIFYTSLAVPVVPMSIKILEYIKIVGNNLYLEEIAIHSINPALSIPFVCTKFCEIYKTIPQKVADKLLGPTIPPWFVVEFFRYCPLLSEAQLETKLGSSLARLFLILLDMAKYQGLIQGLKFNFTHSDVITLDAIFESTGSFGKSSDQGYNNYLGMLATTIFQDPNSVVHALVKGYSSYLRLHMIYGSPALKAILPSLNQIDVHPACLSIILNNSEIKIDKFTSPELESKATKIIWGIYSFGYETVVEFKQSIQSTNLIDWLCFPPGQSGSGGKFGLSRHEELYREWTILPFNARMEVTKFTISWLFRLPIFQIELDSFLGLAPVEFINDYIDRVCGSNGRTPRLGVS